jgi:hypothetical protein
MTMQCIVTKYLGPTNTRGARIKATASGGRYSVTIGYPHELSGEAAHWEAARQLISKFGWAWTYHGGELQTGYVFVPDVGEGRTA